MDSRAQGYPPKFRRFGPVGPVYEIVGIVRELEDGDKMLKIRVVESGEEAEYRLSDASGDPEAE
jgi:hypothetical protein